ncbi:sodium-independent sulfate anion transporter [Nilaparvata lugens]|uniref:sodium-independent sulfate anion transporter n=1 Tax=Nilaparvata lugens TaxID=108931 RepID=UPI00193D6574|nr:sodium-independent sulfate anion transporter [Nilaparvata lugens]
MSVKQINSMASSKIEPQPRWKLNSKEILEKRIPIIKRLQTYTRVDFVSDFIAGTTIGLTMIPQSIAYASLAGLSPQYGLNSTFIGSFLYAIFGTVKEVSIGPTSLMALLTFEYTRELTPDFVIMLVFVSGIVEFLMALLKLGFLVNFISTPVTSGFTTATSIIIIVSQLKGLLGVRFKSCGFIDNIFELIMHASEARLAADFVLGLFCIFTLLALRKLKDIPISDETPSKRVLKKILWFTSIGRNALVVLICAGVAAWYESRPDGKVPFLLSRQGASGIPPFTLPPTEAKVGNQTYDAGQMIEELGSGIFVVPIVGVLVNIAIAKAFSSGGVIDATQEMLALSLCNVLGSCFGGMPTCGAFTRSAVSSASSVASPLAGIFSGCLSLLAVNFLPQYLHLIPRAALSSILICAVSFLIDWQIIMPLWRTNKRDLFILIATFFTCLAFGVEIGLLVGVTFDLCHLLHLWASPKILHERIKSPNYEIEYILITPDKGLFFPAVDRLYSSFVTVLSDSIINNFPIVINCIHFTGIDYTSAKVSTLYTLSIWKLIELHIYLLIQIDVFLLIFAPTFEALAFKIFIFYNLILK